MRTAKIVIGCLGFAFLATVGYMMMLGAAWDDAMGQPSFYEVSRDPSPSGGVEAVVVEIDGGATTSYGYAVYLVPPGKPTKAGVQVASLYGAIRNNIAYGVDLRWIDSTHLVIEHWEAVSAVLLSARTTIDGHSIAVKIRSGVYNPKAPAGRMGYSLRKGNKGTAR